MEKLHKKLDYLGKVGIGVLIFLVTTSLGLVIDIAIRLPALLP